MIEIFSYLLILTTCLYVVAPLLARQKMSLEKTDQNGENLLDLHHQKRLIADTIADLDFDLEMGQLAQEDYADLLKNQQERLTRIDSKLKNKTGTSFESLQNKLEAEIAREIQKNQPATDFSCKKCGHQLQATDKFCPNCGTKHEK